MANVCHKVMHFAAGVESRRHDPGRRCHELLCRLRSCTDTRTCGVGTTPVDIASPERRAAANAVGAIRVYPTAARSAPEASRYESRTLLCVFHAPSTRIDVFSLASQLR